MTIKKSRTYLQDFNSHYTLCSLARPPLYCAFNKTIAGVEFLLHYLRVVEQFTSCLQYNIVYRVIGSVYVSDLLCNKKLCVNRSRII